MLHFQPNMRNFIVYNFKTSQVGQSINERELLVCLHDIGELNINHINVFYVRSFTETWKRTLSSFKRRHIYFF